MFRPNTKAMLYRKSSVRSVFGKEGYAAPQRIGCSVVRLANDVTPSTVRADSSASRGSADDTVADAKLLVSPKTIIKAGDVLELFGFRIEVNGVQPRINTRGQLDHFEVTGDIKAER